MKLKHLGVIGYGNIAQTLMPILAEHLETRLQQVSIFVRSRHLANTQNLCQKALPPVAEHYQVVSNLDDFLKKQPDLVIECAGHEAVSELVPVVLRQGIETVLASIGALSDSSLYEKLNSAAREGQTQIILCAGAIGGIDILASLKLAKIQEVVYSSRKPSQAWKNTASRTTNGSFSTFSRALIL